jgi:hypothetical protein
MQLKREGGTREAACPVKDEEDNEGNELKEGKKKGRSRLNKGKMLIN